MKIRSVKFNNKKKGFEVKASGKSYFLPYVKARPAPMPDDPVSRAYVDREIGGEGFSYELQSGKSGTVAITTARMVRFQKSGEIAKAPKRS